MADNEKLLQLTSGGDGNVHTDTVGSTSGHAVHVVLNMKEMTGVVFLNDERSLIRMSDGTSYSIEGKELTLRLYTYLTQQVTAI